MKRGYLKAAVAVIWLGMLAWLIRYEAFPEWFTHSLSGYSHLLSRDVLVMESWTKILFKGGAIGYSHTSMDVNESDPVKHYAINSQVHLRLKIMGEDQTITVDTTAYLDALYELQEFSFSLTSRGYALQVEALRKRERTFKVKLSTGSTVQRMNVEIPADVILYSPMTELAMKQLKPGQHFSIKTLDPASFSTALVTIEAVRKESIVVAGKSYDATVLSTEYRGTSVLSWIDSDGNILRQETPFGWSMEKCTPEEALAILHGAAPVQDILAAMAVPCEGTINGPRQSKKLKLKLKGVRFAKSELEISDRQRVVGGEGTDTILEVTAAGSAPAPASSLDALKPYLAATPTLQADHPDMVRQARDIIAGQATPRERRRAVYEWVHRNVSKEMTISLPSALDVLHTLKGDCNEHTYLAVALARAAGIPAKVIVGIAYHEGAFYYHAWPSLYAEGWVEMDPTWGQEAVDATHIALVEGEMEQQLQLIKVMGQLRIQVLKE